MRHAARGFTIVELLAVLGTTVAVGGVYAIGAGAGQPQGGGGLMGDLKAARATARQLKDSTQIRGIAQSLVIWAQNNQNKYPLPSELDTKDATVPEKGAAKNTTANVFSLLIFNGFISPELCVSPDESNRQIAPDVNYSYVNPKKAVRPAEALWDPAFKVDFTQPRKAGNVSYAHLQPSDNRLPMWSDTFSATEAVIANRGPEIESVSVANGDYAFKTVRSESNTYRIHGPKDSWEGHVGFNDSHVEFVTTLAPEGDAWASYTNKDGGRRLDTYFFDERDDPDHKNIFLGIFTKAGSKPEEFKAIWD